MKLPERFRDDRADDPLDPEVEEELAGIDAALAGGPLAPGSEEMGQLVRELRAERAEPDPDFAAQLDRWAAEGFPRAQRPGAAPGWRERTIASIEQMGSRVRSLQLRKLALPVGAAATALVVVGVAISQVDTGSDQSATFSEGGDAAHQQQAPAAPGQTEGADSAAPGEGENGAGFLPGEATTRRESSLDQSLEESASPAQKATANRQVARTADLVLASDPEEIPAVADGVNEVVNRYRGFITSSSVSSGDAGQARDLGAQFRMRIPAKSLQPALADLSELAQVRSRTEATNDITGQFLSAQERIEENEAARDGLIERLAEADTDIEAAAIRAQLRIVNSQLSSARADLAASQDRVQLVPVSVSIVAEEGASAREDRGDDGWSVGDAIKDAGDVLSTTAGIAIIVGALLLPLTLAGLIIALALRARTSRSRQRALDEE